MSLVHFNPWRKIDDIEHRLHHLHPEHHFHSLLDDLVSTESNDVNNFTKVPAAELIETDSAFYLRLEIPGMKVEDLDIEATEKSVSINGERKAETESKKHGHTKSELHYGKFHRVIPLPVKIQNTKVTANYRNGILSLTLPKMTEDKNKAVKVNIGS
ncbi:Hsp20/alpha crystallin family protein [Mastigocoleus testarum]|uniref:Heat-shock protein n=1 Tax=Mastigocoleus testarum BC008 TaxID=371196 RepID=A0A0V7ZPH0_9CYAN|nr:Hsp20/alpha crystallin family protein [Mastigocoleus testarum]KST66353.1 heat-shock protein [Mastigocoleus testarum BC008]KST66674.1 heat-shock protein [Mastigocoleus testarum BC008]